MRSFFRRPSWATNEAEDLAPNFYRRSKQTYSDIVAENREARGRSTVSPNASLVEHGAAIKRRRVSDERCVKNGSLLEALGEHHDTAHGTVRSPVSSYPRSDNSTETESFREDKSIPEVPDAANNSPNDTGAVVFDCENSPCEELAGHGSCELLISDSSLGANKATGDSYFSGHGDTRGQKNSPGRYIDRSPESMQEDSVVQILITSDIENTKPLIVRRKMSQGLKDVRLAWCKRQSIPEELQASVILTWKGRRLFDVTTCKSLGVNTEHRDLDNDEGDDDLHIHMEAVMEGIFMSNKRRSLPPTGAEPDSRSEDVESDEQDLLIRVVLKCPGFYEFRVKAKPKTQVSRLVAAFRDAQHISTDQQVHLLFDGDRLELDSCLEDYDITDLDLVDVQIK